MRLLIFLLLVITLWWFISGLEETPPAKAEDSFIGGPVKALRNAEDFEKNFLEAEQQRQQRMEEQLEKDSGG